MRKTPHGSFTLAETLKLVEITASQDTVHADKAMCDVDAASLYLWYCCSTVFSLLANGYKGGSWLNTVKLQDDVTIMENIISRFPQSVSTIQMFSDAAEHSHSVS